MKCMGKRKKAADFAYNNTWSYSVLYGTLAETGDLLYIWICGKATGTPATSQDVLPGMIKRVPFGRCGCVPTVATMTAGAKLRGEKVEFFIVAKKHANDEGRACAPGKRMEPI